MVRKAHNCVGALFRSGEVARYPSTSRRISSAPMWPDGGVRGGKTSGEYAMTRLDPNEEISHLLRGAYDRYAPSPPPHSEVVLDFLLLIVICGMLLAILIVGLM